MNPRIDELANQAQKEALAQVADAVELVSLGKALAGDVAIELFAKAIIADCMVEVKKLVAADTADTIEQQIKEHFGF
jgi:hypothetical protein